MIVATCQIVLDIIRHGYLKLGNFNLMVFDECHHGQKEHPMAILMAKFCEKDQGDLPRVIGLTGSLTKSAVKVINVISDLQELENTFRASITTAKGPKAFHDVLMYSTAPNERVISYETARTSDTAVFKRIKFKVDMLIETIRTWPFEINVTKDPIMNKKPGPQSGLKSSLNDLIFHLKDYGWF